MLIPLWEYILIEPIKETVTESGLLIEEEKTGVVKGKITALGEVELKSTLKLGDVVYFGEYSPDIVNGQYLIRVDNIICKEW
jgi:co-chaperonin GroES (HSP10)